jgi:hypothetical protein
MTENVDEDGSVLFSADELAPGALLSFNITVRPKLFGTYESTRARIRYSSSIIIEDVEEDIRGGYSTSLGKSRCKY